MDIVNIFGVLICIYKTYSDVPCVPDHTSEPNRQVFLKATCGELLRLAQTAMINPTASISNYISNVFVNSLISLSAAANECIMQVLSEVDACYVFSSATKQWFANQYKSIDFFKLGPLSKLMKFVYQLRNDQFDASPFGYELGTVNGNIVFYRLAWVDLFCAIRNRLAHHSPYLLQSDFEEMELLGISNSADDHAMAYYKFVHMIANNVDMMAKQI